MSIIATPAAPRLVDDAKAATLRRLDRVIPALATFAAIVCTSVAVGWIGFAITRAAIAQVREGGTSVVVGMAAAPIASVTVLLLLGVLVPRSGDRTADRANVHGVLRDWAAPATAASALFAGVALFAVALFRWSTDMLPGVVVAMVTAGGAYYLMLRRDRTEDLG